MQLEAAVPPGNCEQRQLCRFLDCLSGQQPVVGNPTGTWAACGRVLGADSQLKGPVDGLAGRADPPASVQLHLGCSSY